MAQNSYDDYKSLIIEVLEASNEPLTQTEIAERVHKLRKLPVNNEWWKSTIRWYVIKLNKEHIIERNYGLKYYLPNVNNAEPYPQDATISTLEALIDEIRYNIRQLTFCFFRNEKNVRAYIIDPILDCLGWRLPFVEREATCRKGNEDSSKKSRFMVDYALSKDRKYAILIEAKEMNAKIDSKLINEVRSKYINDERFQGVIGIITNGFQWVCLLPGNTITTNIDSNNFLTFLNLIRYDNFTLEAMSGFRLNENKCFDIRGNFDVIYHDNSNENICFNNMSDTIWHFVNNHKEGILEMHNQQLFKNIIISDDIKDFRNEVEVSKHPIIIDGKKYYVTRDYINEIKRMHIQKAISFLHINATVEGK